MRTRFVPFLNVRIEHGYFDRPAEVLHLEALPATARLLKGWRMLTRHTPARFELMAEVDEADQRFAPDEALLGRTLHFVLRTVDAQLDNITAPLGMPPGLRPWWRSTAAPGVLAGPQALRLSGRHLRVETSFSTRPVTLRMLTEDGVERAAQVLKDGDDGVTWPLAWPDGLWRAEERAGASVREQAVLVDDALDAARAWGVLSLTLGAAELAAPPTYTLRLDARSDTLRYYVVAQRYSQADFDALSVLDTGAAADARPALAFARVEAAGFGPAHLSASLLDAAGTARVALFESQAPATRRERGLRGIELHRNGDVMLNHLPAPGPGRADAQFVVHLNQP